MPQSPAILETPPASHKETHLPSLPLAVALLLAAVFVAQTPSTGAELTSSTYLKAGFSPVAITTDSAGNIYLTGDVVLDPLSSRQGVLVVKLNPQDTQYLYETYINGSSFELTGGIAVDSAGNAYVAGTTYSADFPVMPGGALTTSVSASSDRPPFLTKLDQNGIIRLSCIFGGRTEMQSPSRPTATFW